MIGAEQRIAAGYAAFQRGDYESARRELTGLRHPQALHILGLSEKRAGRLSSAADALAQAAELDPQNHEIANNQGLTARAAGDMDEAEVHFRRALSLKPDFVTAVRSLARTLTDLKRWDEAAAVYKRQGELEVDSGNGVYGQAWCALEAGEAERAETLLTPLIEAGPTAARHFMRGRARLEQGNIEGGLIDLQVAHGTEPSELSLRTLAGTYWMLGERGAFSDVLARAGPQLGFAVTDITRQTEDFAAALEAWQRMPEEVRRQSAGLALKALIHREAGEAEAAFEAAKAAFGLQPFDAGVTDQYIAAALMCGEAETALGAAREMRARFPLQQHWIAHEATALRLLGDETAGGLLDVERLVRAYDLPVPAGYASLEAFNAEFCAVLERHRKYTAAPLNQSLRQGAQTARDLTAIDEPVIKAYIAALDQPIRQYMADIGDAPSHPTTARNTGAYRFNGMWSVKLTGQGRHVSHVHPEGWVSSAYYAAVPEGEGKAGWIKFGEPPFRTVPESPPLKWVKPKPGVLVLFPSYMWHGTHPIADDAERVTAPFDLLPE